jgi:hypothetical protein
MRWNLFILAVGGLAMSACSVDLAAPEPAPNLMAGALVAELTVAPSAVAPYGTFTATYTVHNTGSEDAHLTTACAAPARGVVYLGEAEAHFMGSSSGCRTSLGQHSIPAGGMLQRSWEVTAAIIVEAYPDGRPPLTRPAEPGEYVFRVEPDVMMINGAQAELPALSHAVVVS